MSTEKLSSKSSLLEEQDIKELVEFRKIKPEDFYLLEELAKMSKRLLIMDLHNFFSFHRKNSKNELRKLLVYTETRIDDPSLEERKAMYGLFLKLLENYDWTVVWNIEIVLERRKIKL